MQLELQRIFNFSISTRTVSRWLDWFCYFFIASFIYVIPRFDPLPTSFLSIFTILGLILFVRKTPAVLSKYRGGPGIVLIFFLALFGYQIVVDYLVAAEFTRVIYILAFLCMILIISRSSSSCDEKYVERLANAYIVILCLSVGWFFLTYFLSDFFQIHSIMYSYNPVEVAMHMVSGLASEPHLFGYQLVPLSCMLVAMTAVLHGRKQKFAFVCVLASALAIFLYAERSVIVAVLTGILFLLFRREDRSIVMKLIFLLAMVLMLSVAIMPVGEKGNVTSYQQTQDLFERAMSDRLQQEGRNRLLLQWKGFQVLLENPEGLIIAGQSWEDVIWGKGYAMFHTWGGVIAVHNGYLGQSIKYGWIMLAMILVVIYMMVRMSVDLVKSRSADSRTVCYRAMLGSATIGSLVQAFFHNASFANPETSTVALFCLTLASYASMKAQEIKE